MKTTGLVIPDRVVAFYEAENATKNATRKTQWIDGKVQ
jgi:hypothetical protein